MLHAAEASEHLNQIFSVAVENLPGAASHSSMKLYALAFALHMQSPSVAAVASYHNTAQAGGQSNLRHRSASTESCAANRAPPLALTAKLGIGAVGRPGRDLLLYSSRNGHHQQSILQTSAQLAHSLTLP